MKQTGKGRILIMRGSEELEVTQQAFDSVYRSKGFKIVRELPDREAKDSKPEQKHNYAKMVSITGANFREV